MRPATKTPESPTASNPADMFSTAISLVKNPANGGVPISDSMASQSASEVALM
jgi:hypothetical protein